MSVLTQRTVGVVKEALADVGAANEVLAFLQGGKGLVVAATMTLPVGYNVVLASTTPTTNTVVLTLPPAMSCGIGTLITVLKTDTDSHAITVTAAGSDKINGSGTYSVAATQYKRVGLVSDGSANWYVVNAN